MQQEKHIRTQNYKYLNFGIGVAKTHKIRISVQIRIVYRKLLTVMNRVDCTKQDS